MLFLNLFSLATIARKLRFSVFMLNAAYTAFPHSPFSEFFAFHKHFTNYFALAGISHLAANKHHFFAAQGNMLFLNLFSLATITRKLRLFCIYTQCCLHRTSPLTFFRIFLLLFFVNVFISFFARPYCFYILFFPFYHSPHAANCVLPRKTISYQKIIQIIIYFFCKTT